MSGTDTTGFIFMFLFAIFDHPYPADIAIRDASTRGNKGRGCRKPFSISDGRILGILYMNLRRSSNSLDDKSVGLCAMATPVRRALVVGAGSRPACVRGARAANPAWDSRRHGDG